MNRYRDYEILSWFVIICLGVALFAGVLFPEDNTPVINSEAQINSEQVTAAVVPDIDQPDIVITSETPAAAVTDPEVLAVSDDPELNRIENSEEEFEVSSNEPELIRVRKAADIILSTDYLTFLYASETSSNIIYTVQYNSKYSTPRSEIDLVAQQIANVYKLDAINTQITVMAVSSSNPDLVVYTAYGNK